MTEIVEPEAPEAGTARCFEPAGLDAADRRAAAVICEYVGVVGSNLRPKYSESSSRHRYANSST